MFLPNIDASSIAPMLALKKEFPDNIFCMMGLHPCSVDKKFQDELKVAKHWLTKGIFCGIGETGIDLYWDKTHFEQQVDSFTTQLSWAKEMNLPIIIHTRNSFDETFSIVSKNNSQDLRGIFHCFSGDEAQARKIISLGGFYLGIGGVLTFKNSGLAEAIKNIPLEHIVLETDAPYLPPVPFRGKRNESSYIKLIAEKLADIKQVSFEEVSRITTANAEKIFNLQ